MQAADDAVRTVLQDSTKFKLKAEIGDKAYAWLNRMENLDQYLKAIMTGGVAGTAVVTAAILSMGPVAKVMLALGLITLPWSIAVAVGLGTATATLATVRMVKRGRKKMIAEVPMFVSCPLDALAASVADLLLPPCVLLSDKLQKAENILVQDWGYDRKYVKWLVEQIRKQPDKFSLTSRAQILRGSKFVMQHVACDRLAREIERLSSEVGAARDYSQRTLLDAFRRYLAGDRAVTLETVRMLEAVVLGNEVTDEVETPRPRPGMSDGKPALWRRIVRRTT